MYRRFWAEYMRLVREGGAPEATDELRATATGRALESVEMHLWSQHIGRRRTRRVDNLLGRCGVCHAEGTPDLEAP